MSKRKYGRRECEICERRTTDLTDTHGIEGTCPEHGRIAAWITGIRQNRIDELEAALNRARLA